MAKTKVLLISYYWPPAGGAGVQRWLKMSKYIVDHDIDLTVYTPQDPEYPAIDEHNAKEIDPRVKVIKHPIIEPYGFYKRFTGKKKEDKIYSVFIKDKKSWKQDLSLWVRSNFFIPDARCLWVKPSIKYLSKYLTEYPADVIISTGPPHSMHLIAQALKKKNPFIKWIADFRDPWTNIDFYQQLSLTKYANKKHRSLEKQVLENADRVVAVSWTMADELKDISRRTVDVITNGYDAADFNLDVPVKNPYEITYLGSMNGDRNPQVLWRALQKLKTSNTALYKKISVNLVGKVDMSIRSDVERYSLEGKVAFKDFVPHEEAIHIMQSSGALLLVVNNTPNATGILTSKAFEYLGAGRPILCVGPENGDIKKLLSVYDHTRYVEYTEDSKCVEALCELFEIENSLSEDIDKFSRANLAKEFAKICIE